MKTTVFWILVTCIMLAMLAEISITLKPFKITFGATYAFFGTVFMILMITCYGIHYENKGQKKGYSEAVRDMNEAIQQAVKESEVKI